MANIISSREDGIITDLNTGSVVATTKQCCHCGNHFISKKGSGKMRGWCTKCSAITCGKIKCCVCVPFEKKLELAEAGKIILR
jgi:hypothetical protein